ncbi:ferric reductase like transmembrane component-domain-containing protein [Pyronema omphalodes]|nr:ferric reductase like transmembrane component-domain-containing protein [Pyronema omphalodes]
MAVVNLVPLFLCMMRNNYIGKITGISFSTWNLYHRWAGRIVVIESFCHTTAWMINQVDYDGWAGIGLAIQEKRFLQMGLLGVVSLFLILVTSVAPLRHAHYQVFLGLHQVCIAMFLSGAWFHCYIDQLPHQIYVNIAIGLWIGERLHRLFNILRKNNIFGKSWNVTTAELQLTLSGEDAVRVSIRMPGVWNYKPGQHAYIYMPRLSWTQSHPFSIAWSTTTMESIPVAESTMAVVDSGSSVKDDSPRYYVEEPRTTIHFVIQRHAGFTNRLFLQASENARQYFLDPERAEHKPPRFLAMVEGPYSSESYSFDSFPTVLFVAGGAGITHPLGFIRHLLIASAENLVATRRIKLVWIIRDKNNCGWISDWLEELWHLDADREILEVEIYVTRPDKMKDRRTRMGGRKIKWMVGRPQHEVIISGMLTPHKKQGPAGALAVNACGSGSVCDGVRAAVREKLHEARIEYSEESFSWS